VGNWKAEIFRKMILENVESGNFPQDVRGRGGNFPH